MESAEREELKQLLAERAAEWERDVPGLVVDDFVKIDAHMASSRTSEAEILVFGLRRDELCRLHTAYLAYQYLIGIIDSHVIGDEWLCQLLQEAREDIPPARFADNEVPFQLTWDDPQWFEWFVREFVGLPRRSSHAFWHKIAFNLDDITIEGDGGQLG